MRGFLVLLFLFVAGCSSTSSKTGSMVDACQEKRAAWDLGSGSIKVKAALVNICELKIIQVLLDESQRTNFKEDLDRSRTKEFRESTKTEARQFISKMMAKLKDLGVEKHLGVATAAFREASNAKPFIEQLNREFSVNVKVIAQQEEGQWGYNAAQTKLPRPGAKVLVWDIGGGSQQLVTPAVNGQILVVESPWASVSFKNWLLKQTQKKGPSPNPLTQEQVDVGVQQAEARGKELRSQLPPGLDTEAYGIGGVHASSLVNRMKKMTYQKQDLELALKKVLGKADAELKSPYAATEVTNLVFVLGMMKGLGLEKVHSLKVNLTDGLLVFGHF